MTLTPPSTPAFDAFVDRQVRDAAPRARDFSDLLARLPGVTPPDAMQSLARLGDGKNSPFARLLDEARTLSPPGRPLDQGEGLPLPHPLDMEWRFTPSSAARLLQALLDETRDGDAILLLGVPTAAAAAARSLSDRLFQVIGEDNVICRALEQATGRDARFVHGDKAGPKAAAALIDPPWYLDAYVEMLTTCSQRCAEGAQVLLVLPPPGIRPSALDDRRQMVDAAIAAGFDVEDEPEPLHYRSPLFELAAWRAAGIGVWLPDWRTGERVRLTKKRSPAKRVTMPCHPAAFELTLDGVRMKLLLDRSGPSRLEPVVAGGTLPSISARFPGRERASLWTTSNGAYAIDPRLALVALGALAADHHVVLPQRLTSQDFGSEDPGTIDATRELTHHLADLATREVAIAEALVGETAWLRGLNDARYSGAPWPGFRQIPRGAAA